jgi:hypothetical protein
VLRECKALPAFKEQLERKEVPEILALKVFKEYRV